MKEGRRRRVRGHGRESSSRVGEIVTKRGARERGVKSCGELITGQISPRPP